MQDLFVLGWLVNYFWTILSDLLEFWIGQDVWIKSLIYLQYFGLIKLKGGIKVTYRLSSTKQCKFEEIWWNLKSERIPDRKSNFYFIKTKITNRKTLSPKFSQGWILKNR